MCSLTIECVLLHSIVTEGTHLEVGEGNGDEGGDD